MLVQNKGDYIRHAENVMIVPGANEVSEANWKKFSAHPLMKILIDDGEIVAVKGGSTKDLSAEKAIELVKDTYDAALLEAWLSEDSRKTVQEAINFQLGELRGTNPPEDDE